MKSLAAKKSSTLRWVVCLTTIATLPINSSIVSAGTLTRKLGRKTTTTTTTRIQEKFTPGRLSTSPQSRDTLAPPKPICKSCTGDMAFVGDHKNSLRLYLLIGDQFQHSPDGGSTWTKATRLDPDNDAATARLDGLDGQLAVLNDGSFVVSAMTSLDDPLGRTPKFGGALYDSRPDRTITDDPFIFQRIPEGDNNPSLFEFLDHPRLAVHPRDSLPSATFYLAANEVLFKSFEKGRRTDPAVYVLTLPKGPDQETPIELLRFHIEWDTPDAVTIAESIAVDHEGRLYLAVLTGKLERGAALETKVLRFDNPKGSEDPVLLDGPKETSTRRVLFPRIPSQKPQDWSVNIGPQLLVDTTPTSRHRGRLYLVWAQEEKPTDDGAFGSNYDIYVSFLDSPSTDTKWSTAVRVNKDPKGDQVQPFAQLDLDLDTKDGTPALHVVWLSRDNPDSALFDVYYARSEDGGITFPENRRITDKSLTIPSAPLGDPFETLVAYTKVAYIMHPCGAGAADRCLAKVERGQAQKHLTLDPIPPQDAEEGKTLKIILQARDVDHHDVIYSMRSPTLPSTLLDQKTGIFSWTPPYEEVNAGAPPKEHTVKVTATDQPPSGSPVSDSQTFKIIVKDVNRELAFVEPTPKEGDKVFGQEGSPVPLTVLARDPDGSTVTYEIVRADSTVPPKATLNPSTGKLEWIPAYTEVREGEKPYTVKVKAKTGGPSPKSIERTITIIVKHVSRPPTIVLEPNVTTYQKKAGEQVFFTVSALPEGGPVDFALFPQEDKRPKGVVWSPTTATFSWNLEETDVRESSYEFEILAIERGGRPNSDSKKKISISVDTANVRPQVIFIAPEPDKRITDPSKPVTVQVRATDPDGRITKVDFYRGSQWLGEGTLIDAARSLYSFDVPLPGGGFYVITAKVTDNHLPQSATAEAKTNLNANFPPSVRVVQPINGAQWTASGSYLLIAKASDADGSIKDVEFFKNGSDDPVVKATKDPSGTWSGSWPNVPGGNNELFAVATDQEGVKTKSASVFVPTTAPDGSIPPPPQVTTPPPSQPPPTTAPTSKPPTVSITAPKNGEKFSQPATVTLSAEASDVDVDGHITKVEFFFVESNIRLDEDRTSPYTFTWEHVTGGTYTVVAKATDNTGLTNTSDPVQFTVISNKAPAVEAGEYPAIYLPNQLKLNGSAEDDGLPLPARFTVGWSVRQAPPNGTVDFGGKEKTKDPTVKFTAPGEYTLRLTATDGILVSYDDVTILVLSGTGPVTKSVNKPPVRGQASTVQPSGSVRIIRRRTR